MIFDLQNLAQLAQNMDYNSYILFTVVFGIATVEFAYMCLKYGPSVMGIDVPLARYTRSADIDNDVVIILIGRLSDHDHFGGD